MYVIRDRILIYVWYWQTVLSPGNGFPSICYCRKGVYMQQELYAMLPNLHNLTLHNYCEMVHYVIKRIKRASHYSNIIVHLDLLWNLLTVFLKNLNSLLYTLNIISKIYIVKVHSSVIFHWILTTHCLTTLDISENHHWGYLWWESNNSPYLYILVFTEAKVKQQ